MNDNVRERIYELLIRLDGKQFKDFKWRLQHIDYDGKPNISTISLEKATQQNVVDLMIQHYEEEEVLEVCTQIFHKINRNDLARQLEETQQKDADAHQLSDLADYRSHVKRNFHTIEDPNSNFGEYVYLNQRYSNLILVDYHRSEEERQHEIIAIGRKHAEMISKRDKTSTSIETLFNPDKDGITPKVVVLQGAAGIGKTIMAKKIMLDWASQQLYQDKFNYAFYIYCREMNLHADSEKISIAEIISKQWPKCHTVKKVIQNILKNVEKLLFIIDGFDELRYSFDECEVCCCTNPWKKEPVESLLRSLFKKKILPESYLIITTRPTALKKLHQCLEHPRYIEILGFSIKEREEYFYRFFENKEQATKAFRFVKQNDMLFTMCVIPLVSWIICTVMKQEMETSKYLQKIPYTLTAIYMLYFCSLLTFHHKKSNQEGQTNVKGLCSLAAEAIWKQQILFTEDELKEHNLHQEDSLPLFLNEKISKRDIDHIQIYSFIHLSFQEFFVALFYVLEEGEEQHSENLNKNLQTLLERCTSSRLDFVVVFHFLFGFLNEEKRMAELKKKFGWKISPKTKDLLLDWMKINIKKGGIGSNLQQEMLCYLYETQDDNIVKNVLYDLTAVHCVCNSGMEWIILTYCIQHCQNLIDFSVECPPFPHEAKRELLPSEIEEWSLVEKYKEDFFKALTKLRKLRVLSFWRCSFTKSCSRHLAEVIRNSQWITRLYLYFRETDDRALDLLLVELQHPDCNIETLCFWGHSLTESWSRHLAEILKKSKLRKLKLDFTDIDDKTMEVLCEGLQHPDCKIKLLQICGEFLKDSWRRHLARILGINPTLSALNLHDDSSSDNKEKLLYEEVKHSGHKLKELWLNERLIISNGEWNEKMLCGNDLGRQEEELQLSPPSDNRQLSPQK